MTFEQLILEFSGELVVVMIGFDYAQKRFDMSTCLEDLLSTMSDLCSQRSLVE